MLFKQGDCILLVSNERNKSKRYDHQVIEADIQEGSSYQLLTRRDWNGNLIRENEAPLKVETVVVHRSPLKASYASRQTFYLVLRGGFVYK